MKRFQDLFSGESELFGPGIDLVISLVAILLIVTVVSAYSHKITKEELEDKISNLNANHEKFKQEYNKL